MPPSSVRRRLLKCGLTWGLREAIGANDSVDPDSWAYWAGAAFGEVHGRLLRKPPGPWGLPAHGNSRYCRKLREVYKLIETATRKVFRYGQSTKGEKRYSKKSLDRRGLKYLPTGFSTRSVLTAHQIEKRLIQRYEQRYGHKPPGNKGLY